MSGPKESEKLPENEFRISALCSVNGVLKRMGEVLAKHDNIQISGINLGINKTLLICEVAKIRFPELFQVIRLESLESVENKPKDTERKRFTNRIIVNLYKEEPKKIDGFLSKPSYTKETIEKFEEAYKSERKRRSVRRGFGRGFRNGRGFRGGRGFGRGFRRGGFRGGRGYARNRRH